MTSPVRNCSSLPLLLLAASAALGLGCGGEAESDLPSRTPSALQPPERWEAPPTPPDTPVARNGLLRVEGSQLVNESGDPVQLQGVSTMWLNWESRFATSKSGLQFMRDDWGVTVIRAAMGVEERNGYLRNPTGMVTIVRTIVRNAAELGLYVIIDWHDHNAEDNTDEAKEFFSRMAIEFGHLPNVLYETFNEPTRQSWSDVVKPYHEAVIPEIRAADPDNIIILGSPEWSQKVDAAAADPVEGDNLMYTLHFYSCTHQGWLRDRATRAMRRGLPIFVTEWGATDADGGTRENPGVCEDEAHLWNDWMDSNQISWAAWKLDGCDDDSCFFNSRGVSANGDWEPSVLNGHAPLVLERLAD